MNSFILDLLTFASILSGILVITARNPIVSVLFLIAVFVNVAGYLILLGINFVGLLYIIVYVGAIAILFLFVVMMLNIKLVEINNSYLDTYRNLPLAFIIGTLFFFSIINNTGAIYFNHIYSLFDNINFLIIGKSLSNYNLDLIFNNDWSILFNQFDQISSIASVMYSTHSIWF